MKRHQMKIFYLFIKLLDHFVNSILFEQVVNLMMESVIITDMIM